MDCTVEGVVFGLACGCSLRIGESGGLWIMVCLCGQVVHRQKVEYYLEEASW